MADLVFNIARVARPGSTTRVDLNDPTNAVLLVIAINAGARRYDATLRDYDTMAAMGRCQRRRGHEQRRAQDGDRCRHSRLRPDDANDRVDLDIPNKTWTGVARRLGVDGPDRRRQRQHLWHRLRASCR